MSIFEYVTVAISIILGLGVAQLLSGALELVRFRHVTRFHWAPLVWATVIFWIQLEFWWSLFGASVDPGVWTHFNFLLAAVTALSLIAAGSLILPKRWPEGGLDLIEYFHADGRTGVAAFALFHVLAIPFNSRLLGFPLISVVNLYLVGMIAVQLAVLISKTTRTTSVLTLLFLALQLGVLTVHPAFID